jgi:putative transposase
MNSRRSTKGIWGKKYPAIAQSWRRNWEAVIPFFAFPAELARSSTPQCDQELERLGAQGISQQTYFPSDRAATKLIWLAPRRITERWKRPPPAWPAAKAQLAIQFGERFTFNN